MKEAQLAFSCVLIEFHMSDQIRRDKVMHTSGTNSWTERKQWKPSC